MASNIMNKFRLEMNRLASAGEPFLFITDFNLCKPLIYPLTNIPSGIRYITPGNSNSEAEVVEEKQVRFNIKPVGFEIYTKAYNNVISNISHGNSYLLNLTFPSELDTNLSLKDFYNLSRAKYKLFVEDRFVVFSPETFVRIESDEIKSYPMKGTIDASVPGAIDIIMQDEKELSEHNTIVDLIRNDLSIVADRVEVTRYRYNETLRTNKGSLIQISSEIKGNLGHGWQNRLGDIIVSILPAGSISGAPKEETIRIIRESESDDRGYYTGVFGIFDGSSLDSAVMIRFIEQRGDNYVYRSGGGITFLSDLEKEYKELISKVYVPFG